MLHDDNVQRNQEINKILKTYVNLSPLNILDKDAMYDIRDLFECYGLEHINGLLNGNMTPADLYDFVKKFKEYYECGTDNQIIYIDLINKIIDLSQVCLTKYLNLSKPQTKNII